MVESRKKCREVHCPRGGVRGAVVRRGGRETENGEAKKIVHDRTRSRNIHWLDSPAASLIVTGSSEPVTSESFRFLGRPFCTVPDKAIGLCS